MRAAARIVLLILCCAGVAATAQDRAAGRIQPTLILVSFDGWRWDYERKAPTPNLRSLIARGVRAENLIPSYPSKTFPNHYTIATGLYPGHHGIVANVVRDPQTGRTLRVTNSREVRDPMWWGGEPIWVTAERQRQSTAVMFWVGSEAPIAGIQPRYWKPYNGSYPANDRVDEALRWLGLPDAERPRLLTLYFEDTDRAGHADGPDSPAVLQAIRRADGYLGRLLRGLERGGLADDVNVVVVSDHGMASIDMTRVIVLDAYVSLDDVDVVDINPTLGLFPRPGKEDEVYRALSNAHPRLKVYRKADTPAQWHYRDHPRIPPIVGVADDGWQIAVRGTIADILAGRLRPPGGQHGYDPTLMSMRGIFAAAGPAFKRGATVPAFENVHIYNALARALGVTPAHNDGDPAVAQSLLR